MSEVLPNCASVRMEIEVPAAPGLHPQARVVATIVLPPVGELADRPIVAFALPGAGYSRSYFTFDMPGSAGGGQAGWHAQRGWIFVALDTVGVGEATILDPFDISLPGLAAVNDAAARTILARLAQCRVADTYPAIEAPVTLGIGQSMGGGLTLVQQAHFDTFDGIALLGFSALWTTARGHPGGPPPPTALLARDRLPMEGNVFLHEVRSAVAVNGTLMRLQADQTRYFHKDFAPPSWNYHFDDVPQEIIDRDLGRVGDLPHWRSATVPPAVLWMIGPGALAPEAAAVVVPVLSAFGERDVAEDPRLEHRAFRHAVDFSSFICPRMGHMHNFASTREILWSRTHQWGEHVSDLKRRLPDEWPAQLFSDSY
jgi:hypothetical protein